MMDAGKFPRCRNFGDHLSSHPVWRVAEVLAWFEACGLPVTEDWKRREDKAGPTSRC
jgi:hypothetical protein